MSLFEMASGPLYIKVVFNAKELSVIRAACAYVSTNEHEKMGNMADADLEQAASQAERASNSHMAEGLVALFKAGQEILIEREDLEPVLESLKSYSRNAPDEHAAMLRSAIEKIEQYFR